MATTTATFQPGFATTGNQTSSSTAMTTSTGNQMAGKNEAGLNSVTPFGNGSTRKFSTDFAATKCQEINAFNSDCIGHIAIWTELRLD